jgi:Coproporphyrinogen III oxidase
MKARWEELIRRAQNEIVAAVEAEDGEGKFSEDAWTRPGGGGGISRVMQVCALPAALMSCATPWSPRALEASSRSFEIAAKSHLCCNRKRLEEQRGSLFQHGICRVSGLLFVKGGSGLRNP